MMGYIATLVTTGLLHCCIHGMGFVVNTNEGDQPCPPLSSPSYVFSPSSISFPAERTTGGTHRPKKARQLQDLVSERVQHPPGPLEQKHPLPSESRESTRNLGRGHSSSAQSFPLRFLPDLDLLAPHTSLPLPSPQDYRFSLHQPMSSKTTLLPRSVAAAGSRPASLRCRGSQVTNY